jgi:hypothetical protein
MGSASRVGALVVLFVALAFGLYAFLGKGLWSQSNEYTVVFDDAGGLNRGAQVLLSGVNIGSVTDVGFTADGKPRAKIEVKKDIALYEGTTALLPGSLVGVGDKVGNNKLAKAAKFGTTQLNESDFMDMIKED